jgi:hypothetical protein
MKIAVLPADGEAVRRNYRPEPCRSLTGSVRSCRVNARAMAPVSISQIGIGFDERLLWHSVILAPGRAGLFENKIPAVPFYAETEIMA